MKKALILAAALALTAVSAQAASYTLTTSAADELAVTDARTRYNNGLDAGDPNRKASNGAFLLMVFGNALQSWAATAVRPALTVTEKNAAVTLLNADVARGDANSATAQALLDKLNAAN